MSNAFNPCKSTQVLNVGAPRMRRAYIHSNYAFAYERASSALVPQAPQAGEQPSPTTPKREEGKLKVRQVLDITTLDRGSIPNSEPTRQGEYTLPENL